MRLNSIRLGNIRSYQKEEINFPVGSVLLSGNIGSGKSTILLAIDFVLFGLRKGELSGSALLRNGEKRGSVELMFTIDGKDVTIRRNLKRNKDSVVQDYGYIIIDGKKREGTAIELKQAILDIFNYPKELLSKNKSLIYRYTVYTPQEEMKQILLGEKEQRLDTLRRVFGIDKYKRIMENGGVIVGVIKERKKEFEGRASGIEEKREQKSLAENDLGEVKQKLQFILPNLEKLKKAVKEKKEEIALVEKGIKEYNELKKLFALKENDLINKRHQVKKIKDSLETIGNQIAELKKEPLKLAEENIKGLLIIKKKQIDLKKSDFEEIKEKIQESNFVLNSSLNVIGKLKTLDICPQCLQKVAHEHKTKILNEEGAKVTNSQDKINQLLLKRDSIQKIILKLEEELDNLKNKEREHEIIKIKLKNLEDKKLQLKELNELQNSLKKEIGAINGEIIELDGKIEEGKNLEDNYQTLRESLEPLELKLREAELESVSLRSEIRSFGNVVTNLKNEIAKKESYQKTAAYLARLQEWLENYFFNLMKTMEKNIMLKVHSDFGGLFEKWFNMLVDNENITVCLDDEFSPLIEQNGYDIDYGFLSGGEKTAAALAYRLALNQVINNMLSTIKTNDLLILDEPTDGFSSEQLDKIKNILEELNISQIIIVSHESKVESFVDNIIKVVKEENVSKVV